MTSHLSVSNLPVAGAVPGLSSKPAGAGAHGFDSLLEAVGLGSLAGTTDAPTSGATGFAHMAAGSGSRQSAATKDTLLDALARLLPGAKGNGHFSVPLAATAADATGDDAGTPPRLLRELASALSDLDKAEQSGKPVDKDLLKRVKDAVDAVAAFLAAQQPALAQPAVPAEAGSDGAASVAAVATGLSPASPPDGDGTASDDGKAAATDAARASLAKFADRIEQLSSSVAKDQPALSARLDDLAKSLDPKTLAAPVLAALGLGGDGTAADPQLASAINGFINGKAQPSAGNQPVLAAPLLKLPDGTALTSTPGKAKATGIAHTDAAPPSSDTSQPAAATPKPQPAAASATTPATTDDAKAAAQPSTAKAADKPADAPVAATATADASAPPAAVPAAPIQAAAQQVPAAYQSAAPALNLPAMAFEIARYVQQGTSHFQIRLDPADLGRVDVKLAVDGSGSVTAHMTVERAETLDLLRRDAGSLSQAFAQAGLDGSKTSLQFSLSQNPFPRQDGGNTQHSYTPSAAAVDAPADPAASVVALYRGTVAPGGVNLFV